jgi:adenylate cyclase
MRMNAPTVKTLRQLWWAPLACFGLAFAASRTDFIRQLEWHTLDWRIEFRTNFQKPPDPRLAVVLFEDDTESMLGKPWPVDRQYHGQMTQVLALAGAKVVVWDVILDAIREGDGDAFMGQVAQAAGEAGTRVISAAVTNKDPTGAEPGLEGPTRPLLNVEGDIAGLEGDDHAFIPFPQLRAASWYGFADNPPGADGVRREIPLVVRVGKEVYSTLPLQTLLSYFDLKPDQVRVRLGDAVSFTAAGRPFRLPIDRRGCMLLNYRYDHVGNRTDLPVYSYGKLFVSLSSQFLDNKPLSPPPPDLKDKIVFIGQTVTGKADAGPSPLSDLTSLTFVFANLVDNVLADDYVRTLPGWLIWSAAVLVGYVGLVLLADRSMFLLCSGVMLTVVTGPMLVVWLWVWANWDLPLVAPLGGSVALQFIMIGRRVLLEQRAKQEIKGMFGTYVSPQLVDRLVKSGQRPQLGGHDEEITAHFSDIQSFSTFSEMMPPDRLVALMNEYLTVCTDIVQEEGGTLDKYIGDALVAMFGAPIALPDHAYRACIAAVREQTAIAELRARWTSEGSRWPAVVAGTRARIGLNTGRCTIGNMGSRTRFNYTMMGDNVNLAARMESGAKTWGVYAMCTESTRLACVQHGGDRVVFRPLGRIVVKGRSQPVPIHEIMGLKEDLPSAASECVGLFAQGLERYFARDWDGATAWFGQSANLEPNLPGRNPGVTNNPSRFYIQVIEHYKAEPPAGDWDGVYVMKEK